ncbi:MAG: hypothetical protein ACRD2E_08860 [Terriglobales bacterium]
MDKDFPRAWGPGEVVHGFVVPEGELLYARVSARGNGKAPGGIGPCPDGYVRMKRVKFWKTKEENEELRVRKLEREQREVEATLGYQFTRELTRQLGEPGEMEKLVAKLILRAKTGSDRMALELIARLDGKLAPAPRVEAKASTLVMPEWMTGTKQ